MSVRTLRSVSVLALFLASLGLFFHLKWQSDEIRESRLKQAQSRFLFPSMSSEEINDLTIERIGQPSIRLHKPDRNWQIIQPVSASCEPMVVQGILTALRLGKRQEAFEAEEDRQAYGFAPPIIRVSVGTSRSVRKQVLLLGNQVPFRDFYYAKWEGTNEVFLIDRDLWKSFDRNLESLRRKLVFNFDPEEVRGFQIAYSRKAFDIVKKEDAWQIAGSGKRADEKEVARFLELLRGIVVTDYLDREDWKDDRFGLRLRNYYVRVYFDKEKPQTLFLGYPSRDVEGTYVHVDRIFNVALIPSRLARRLDRGMEGFYDSGKS